MKTILATSALLALTAHVSAVDRSKFRLCEQTGFCKRHRNVAHEPHFHVIPSSVSFNEKKFSAILHSEVVGAPNFGFTVDAYASGAARIRLIEKNDLPPRWQSSDVLMEDQMKPVPVNEKPSTEDILRLTGNAAVPTNSYVSYTDASGKLHLLEIVPSPLVVHMYVEGYGSTAPIVTINKDQQMYFEHRRKKDSMESAQNIAAVDPNAGKKVIDWGEDGKPIYEDGTVAEDSNHEVSVSDGLWEESFNGHPDSKPNGPMSVGADISFPGASAVYGIPEHASSYSLHATDGTEGEEYRQPYRLYNLDVFEYELDNPMSLYGSVPFMLAHGPHFGSVGVYWNNPSETFIDIKKNTNREHSTKERGISTKWISESGIFDLFIVPGPTPKAVTSTYATITGRQTLPPTFALGYHQCRWNYKDEADVYSVDASFDQYDFPYDVLWLDIEHTDGKRYFTWDSNLFPHPREMQNALAAKGHRMVTIVDPHIKRDHGFQLHVEATEQRLYCRTADGSDFDGWCWPGSSSYLDFTSEKVREFWGGRFLLDKYDGSTGSLHIWNDMNEPSVFNGPEVSMKKDSISISGVEHREWHNMYGFYQQWATKEGLERRSKDMLQRNIKNMPLIQPLPVPSTHSSNNYDRGFVLSRAFAAGSQRFGAVWTGDNAAEWSHLRASAPMLLSLSTAGIHFSGADVGGFFGNPSTELLQRWYAVGAWQPFFRAHAHIDTARREPWLFGEAVLRSLRESVLERYSFLAHWYTLFYESHTTGVQPMRPMMMEFPNDPDFLETESQWMVGSDLLVLPALQEGSPAVSGVLPAVHGRWRDARTLRVRPTCVNGASAHSSTCNVQLDEDEFVLVLQRPGSIVPRQMRPRRASPQMRTDPYTLNVVADASGKAHGKLFMDDQQTYSYLDGAFRLQGLTLLPPEHAGGAFILRGALLDGTHAFITTNTIEAVNIAGLAAGQPRSISVIDAKGTRNLDFGYDKEADVLTIKKPGCLVGEDFAIQINF